MSAVQLVVVFGLEDAVVVGIEAGRLGGSVETSQDVGRVHLVRGQRVRLQGGGQVKGASTSSKVAACDLENEGRGTEGWSQGQGGLGIGQWSRLGGQMGGTLGCGSSGEGTRVNVRDHRVGRGDGGRRQGDDGSPNLAVTLVMFKVVMQDVAVERGRRAGTDSMSMLSQMAFGSMMMIVSVDVFGTGADGALVGLARVQLGGGVVKEQRG